MEYKHVISLGHACAVAHELERIGLRDHSGPFDWQGSRSFKAKISLINRNFDFFFNDLEPQSLFQRVVPSCYLMKSCSIFFVHDFNEFDTLEAQIPSVRKKYARRVENFYSDIKEPTLFVYYLYDQEDADWIDNNANYILESLKKFNPNNEIVYIADRCIKLKQPCFYVENDEGSDIAWEFVRKNDKLADFFNNIPYSFIQRNKNLAFYKEHNKWKHIKKAKKIINNIIMKCTHKIYHHNLTCFED